MSKKSRASHMPLIFAAAAVILAVSALWQFVLAPRRTNAETAVSSVRFSEVMTANSSAVADDYGAYSDWFEVENTGERAVDLNGYMVVRGTEKLDVYSFGRQTLGAGECALVFASGRSQNNPAYVCHAPFALTGTGETLTLLDKSGAVMDEIEIPALSRNQSYAKMDGGWTITSQYTPGMPNNEANHQLFLSQSGEESGELVISEVMIKNRATLKDSFGEYSDYIELHNTTSHAVNLAGYKLSDDDASPDKFVIASGSIPAGGYMIVFASGRNQAEGELHAPFKLSKGETVYLSSPRGHVISSTLPDTSAADQAWSLTESGWVNDVPATPGASNDFTGAAAVDSSITSANTSSLYISEIMASTNDTSVSSESYDWIEIYNSASGALDLSGWGLSDKSNNPRKWQFPSGATIGAGEYMIVFCSGKDTKDAKGYHTSFALSAEGGYSVTLCDPSGNIVDRMAVSEQYTNVSYGRAYGQTGLRYFEEPTPRAANTTYGYEGRAAEPVYSVTGGMFKAGETITVQLTVPSGSTVYYTTDCTEPTQSSTLYTGPITLNSTTILRTRVYSGTAMPSIVSTQSYFFGIEHAVRVVSLVTAPDNLWDYNTGIYVKGPNAWAESPYGANNQGANFWMDWEKAGNVEVFEADGTVLLSQGCGVKLQGQYSRKEDQKSFKLIARTEYGGGNRFEAKLFDDRDYTEYQSFVLRATGQDGNKARARDVLQTSLADATDVMYQAAEVCAVYLNGEYWGHYNMRERINKYSIAQWEGWTSDPDDIDLIKANRTVMQGSDDTFANLLDWIKNEGGATAREKKETLTQADYDAILEHINTIVDVDNYLDYVAIEMYTGNTDLLNVKRYRSADEDGRWRWILFDMDWGLNILDTNSVRRWLDPEGAGSGKKTDNTLFVELMKNPAIQDRFLRRFNELFLEVFNSGEMLRRLDEYYAQLDTEIDRHLEKWNMKRSTYDSAVTELRNLIRERPSYVMTYIKETFNFTDAQMEDYFGESLKMIEAQSGK